MLFLNYLLVSIALIMKMLKAVLLIRPQSVGLLFIDQWRAEARIVAIVLSQWVGGGPYCGHSIVAMGGRRPVLWLYYCRNGWAEASIVAIVLSQWVGGGPYCGYSIVAMCGQRPVLSLEYCRNGEGGGKVFTFLYVLRWKWGRVEVGFSRMCMSSAGNGEGGGRVFTFM